MRETNERYKAEVMARLERDRVRKAKARAVANGLSPDTVMPDPRFLAPPYAEFYFRGRGRPQRPEPTAEELAEAERIEQVKQAKKAERRRTAASRYKSRTLPLAEAAGDDGQVYLLRLADWSVPWS